MSTLGFIALSLIVESQLIRTNAHKRMIEERLEALKGQEKRYRRAAILNQVPGLNDAISKGAAIIPGVSFLFKDHQLPTLPSNLAEMIGSVAAKL